MTITRQSGVHVGGNDSSDVLLLKVQPMVEGLEDRVLFSAGLLAGLGHGHGNSVGAIVAGLEHHGHHLNAMTLPISISSITQNAGNLVANGKIGANPFTAPVTLTSSKTDPQILDLQLGPIHLDLLGLNVDTSPICLDISATPGTGNLLGNLLTDVANLLNGGTPLGNILGGLSGTQLTGLLNGVTSLLNGALHNVLAPTSLASAATTPPAGTTNLLNLSLGPVKLDLLGLNVNLDNCSNGPVTVAVTAVTGPGNLLGNLLSSVANSLNGSLSPTAATAAIDRLLRDVLTLV